MPCHWVVDLVCGCLHLFHRVLDTRRLNCTSVVSLVSSNEFVAWVVDMIFANAAFIGITSDTSIKRSVDAHEKQSTIRLKERPSKAPKSSSTLRSPSTCCCAWSLEGQFCVGDGRGWNIVDALLVTVSIVDMYLVATNGSLTLVGVLRLFRVIHVVRLLRFAGIFKNLRLMILAIMKSAGPLPIMGFILVILIFFFAVIMLNGAAAYIGEASADDPHVDLTLVYFSSMSMALLALFMSTTGGVSWWEVQHLPLQTHVVCGIIFAGYISSMLLAVLNIITGIFVTDAVDMAASDHELMVKAG